MKTKPHTVRFEESDFDFICKRENLSTAQSILNFLVSEYMKIYKVEKPSIFATTTPESYDGKKFDKVRFDEVGQESKNDLEAQEQEIFKGYAYYETQAKNVKFEDAEALIIEIMASELKSWQINMLKTEINKKFGFEHS